MSDCQFIAYGLSRGVAKSLHHVRTAQRSRLQAINIAKLQWTRGCVDVWTCGCVDAWMCGCVDVWTCGCVDVWTCGCVDVWMCGRVDVSTWPILSRDFEKIGCCVVFAKQNSQNHRNVSYHLSSACLTL
jgi:hypothetical protein